MKFRNRLLLYAALAVVVVVSVRVVAERRAKPFNPFRMADPCPRCEELNRSWQTP